MLVSDRSRLSGSGKVASRPATSFEDIDYDKHTLKKQVGGRSHNQFLRARC
jgi:hypothetical protein